MNYWDISMNKKFTLSIDLIKTILNNMHFQSIIMDYKFFIRKDYWELLLIIKTKVRPIICRIIFCDYNSIVFSDKNINFYELLEKLESCLKNENE